MSNNKRERSGKKRQRSGKKCELQFGNKYGGGAKKKPEADR